MANPVEGTWKGFTFKFIETEDIPKVYEHMRAAYFRDERTCQLSGYSEEFALDMEKLYDAVFCFGERLSFIAVDSTNGKVAGVRLTHTMTKYTSFAHLKFKSQTIKNLFQLINLSNEQADVFNRYGLDHYAFYLAASTSSDYRNQGLASEMYRRSELLLRHHKFPLVTSIFSSPWTRKIATNRKFVEISRVYMKDMKDENGKQLLPNANDDDMACCMALKLE